MTEFILGFKEYQHHRRMFERHILEVIPNQFFDQLLSAFFECIKTNLPIFDVVGNVWEWTASKAAIYSEKSFEQNMDVEGLDDRISRGSSWLSSEEESTQVTFRSFDPPYNAYEDLGLRIAVVEGAK